MVDINMFKDAFVFPKKVAPASPKPVAQPPVQEDPEIAKLKLFFLKWLSIVVGGGAIILIIWRVILKFF